jgi:DNA-binding response OmpR family regulator
MTKILIIEDDFILSSMYKSILESESFQVEVAKDGQEGLTMALSNHPALIVLDIAMPKMDGLSVMKKLREDTKWGCKVPIIIMTSFDTNDEILNRITTDLPAYYLIKSNLTPDTLIEKIKTALSSPTV